MPLSFTLSPHLVRSPARSGKRRVLVTGAAGRIGTYFANHASQKYALRLMARPDDDASAIASFGEVVQADLADTDRLKSLCSGIDTVLHLAANASANAAWDDLLNDNIVGTHNLFAAAKHSSVRRVVFASSIHAVAGHPADMQVHASDPVNPPDLYGVSKCFGEALARYYAEQQGISTICIRIGAFQPETNRKGLADPAMQDAWVSPRDLQQLIERSIDDDRLQFAIFHGLSDNRFKRLDISDARELLAYHPKDSSSQLHVPPGEIHADSKLK